MIWYLCNIKYQSAKKDHFSHTCTFVLNSKGHVEEVFQIPDTALATFGAFLWPSYNLTLHISTETQSNKTRNCPVPLSTRKAADTLHPCDNQGTKWNRKTVRQSSPLISAWLQNSCIFVYPVRRLVSISLAWLSSVSCLPSDRSSVRPRTAECVEQAVTI